MRGTVVAVMTGLLLSTGTALAAPLLPIATRELGDGTALARYSERTVTVALLVDRERVELSGFTLKDRPFKRPARSAPSLDPGAVPVEVVLTGRDGRRHVEVVGVSGLCLEHDPLAPPHVEGDRIRLHRESVLVELPDVAGLDRLEVRVGGAAQRDPWVLLLDGARVRAAGGPFRFDDLALAATAVRSVPAATSENDGAVHWPEEYSDPDIFTVYGNAGEVSKRVNFVIVPDGYTYAEKALMQTHAQQMVAYLRAKTPYAEHDPFSNYVLVYAYSTEDGTDQCDCGTVRDTAMNTYFPDLGYSCGNSAQRCLYYGSGSGTCDVTSTANISAAELRAPAKDFTFVMVNTTRYGGCGGARAVFSGGNSQAFAIADHEMGHVFPDLADEYAYTAGCGSSAGEINTSLNGTTGAWPEWIGNLGTPSVGAQYYQSCVFRPQSNCEMRALGVAFCAVCNQRFALQWFGHPRVGPTAPIESQTPPSPVTTAVGSTVNFSVATRLATGGGVTNDITWQIQGPGYPTPTTVATGTTSYAHLFVSGGTYTLTCEVIADTNYIKPAKYGANVDVATWTISTCGATITLAPGSLPPATVGTPYGQTITASGGTAPYTFAVTAGALPAGLGLSSAGVLSGTPTTAGTATFTVTAADATGCDGSQAYSLIVNGSGCGTIVLNPATLPAATVGAPYSVTITASGGTAPYTFAVTAGALPPGLGLSTGGALAGTPTASGSFAFSVAATDVTGCVGTAPYTLVMGEDFVAGEGLGAPNPNRVRVHGPAGSPTSTDFLAYAAGGWGVNVGAAAIDGSGAASILTAPGPGAVFGPQVRAFTPQAAPLGKVNFYAYGTLRFGATVSAGDTDGDGYAEILTGAGSGVVFGPHVRAFDYDGGTLSAVAKVSFFAYFTLKYGVNVGRADVEADTFDEILTGPGPGAIFGPQVRGFDVDGGSAASIAKINFNAFGIPQYGANVAGGDFDGEGYGEIAATPGPGPGTAFPSRFVGFDFDATAVVPLPGFDVTPYPSIYYGGRVGSGDPSGDGASDLITGAGRDPAADATVNAYGYDGANLAPLSPTFDPFPGQTYGVNVAGGNLGL